jgi:DNA-binding NarL/FixJ family response regulator
VVSDTAKRPRCDTDAARKVSQFAMKPATGSARRSQRPFTLITAGDNRLSNHHEHCTPPPRILIADAMTQQSAEHRAVIERSYYRGWTTAQIASELGIAEGTVKSLLHDAARALRLTLRDMGVTRCRRYGHSAAHWHRMPTVARRLA